MNEVILKDGRTGFSVPWIAKSPKPWREGYSRLYIHFTRSELRNATGNKRGHTQIVHNSKFKAA